MTGGEYPRPSDRPGRPLAVAPGAEPPTFCPRCRADGPAAATLCRECGDVLALRGYCPTCEAFWKRPAGDPCPKHDVALEAAPPDPGPLGAAGRGGERWVTVATYAHPNAANGPRIRLEAEGIPTFLDGERVAGSTLYQVATGGAKLQVPESLAGAARVLLAQTWTARLDPPAGGAAPDDDEDDDPWAGLAPDPGTRRRAIMKVAILVFLFGPGLITLGSILGRLVGLFP